MIPINALAQGTASEAYAALSEGNTVLTFYFDDQKDARSGMGLDANNWYSYKSEIVSVVFDVSFASYNDLTSTVDWFNGFSNLQSITGISNLITDNVNDMSGMFAGCSLSFLDLSGFKTNNVSKMNYMFYGCSNLKGIFVGIGWSVDAVTESTQMFEDCNNLVGGAGTTYSSSNIDYTYARIDGGVYEPGYLTNKNLPVPYALLSNENTVLTFYYDNQKMENDGMNIGPFTMFSNNRWDGHATDITSVVFDDSFTECTTLTSTACWFYQCSNLANITGISNLKTDNVTNMERMFDGCSSLTSLDVSGFNTGNVTDMFAMFEGCSNLENLDVSHFNTGNVTDMFAMFDGCSKLTVLDLSNFNTSNLTSMGLMFMGCSGLTSLDVSGFNTANVVDMNGVFRDCSGLKSLDLSNFNTAKVSDMSQMFAGCNNLLYINLTSFNTASVTSMSRMFYGCPGLVNLDLSSFNTSNVTDVSRMFYYCSHLTTIYAGSGWNNEKVSDSTGLFGNCPNLIGGSGTKSSDGGSDLSDLSYANIDEGSTNPGYFTDIADKESVLPYAVLSEEDTKLTFYYDDQKYSRNGIRVESKIWFYSSDNITTVVFDDSFANCSDLTSLASWFSSCENLTTITGLEYLKTDNVTDMSSMFYKCSKLTSIDLRSFNTANVTDMSQMFSECTQFTTLDLSSFDTEKVENMANMFSACTSLTTIYVGSEWTTDAVTNSYSMFYICNNLIGGKGTTFDDQYDDVTYAHIDGGTTNPGYFTNIAEKDKTPYAVLTENDDDITTTAGTVKGKTLTFYYDNSKVTNSGIDISGIPTLEDKGTITKVVFDGSFANYTDLTSTRYWFASCGELASIEGISNLKTDNVENMEWMFYGCSALTSLDVSHFNTANVTNMEHMFSDCGFTSLDVSSLNTGQVTNMKGMFMNCYSLTSLDLSNFNTGNVTTMLSMFSGCYELTSLDLSGFNTSATTDMSQMFLDCQKLKTIYVGSGWSTENIESDQSLFYSCTSLVGGNGTTFDAEHIDQTYAHIDGGTSNPGYFTDIEDKGKVNEPYAVLTDNDDDITTDAGTIKGKTLTFYYNKRKEQNSGSDVSEKSWLDTKERITSVVFDDSFAEYTGLTSLYGWFSGCSNLKSITNLSNLKTDNVTSMHDMFWGCSSLTYLDLNGFKTDNVTDMNRMFAGCSSLTSLDLVNFNTGKVTDMGGLFSHCTNLTSIGYSSFVTDNVTNMSDMFSNCSSLTVLDLSYCKTDKVTDMGYMFESCSSLTSLHLGSNFVTDNVTNMRGMFTKCSVTTLDLSNFKTDKVTDMNYMFFDCPNLTEIDLSGFNTASVTGMNHMFSGCSAFTTLNLGSFNTANVTDMVSMFSDCSLLTTIYVDPDKWTIEGVKDNSSKSESMFSNCTSLVGENGTVYNANHTDYLYAHIDTEDTPGYFTNVIPTEPYAMLNDDNTVLTFYYDKNRGTSGMDIGPFNAYFDIPWSEQRGTITTVRFDESFAGYTELTSTKWMLGDLVSLTSIEGLENLKTDNVTDMSNMFYGCGITSLDLSSLNTTNVTNMSSMFELCLDLTSLDVSKFNTAKVTDMSHMFYRCEVLENLNITNFVTSSVTDMSDMFHDCKVLTSLDISSFNTEKVTMMGTMFWGSAKLKTIYVGSGWTTSDVTGSNHEESMFLSCSSLVGGNGTAFDESHTGIDYAHIDGGSSNPGYFTDINGVILTAKSYTREYGDDNPTFEYSVDGATLSGTPSITCEAKDTTSVGTYPITITYTKSEGEDDLNITYVNGTLTITKAPATVKSKNANMNYGDDVPTLEVEYSGFKNNETDTVITTKPSVTTQATKASGVGEYDISVSGADAKNYELSYENGILTINKAPLTITAKSYTIKRGGTLPTFEYESSGFKNNETDTVFTTKPTISCEAKPDTVPGTYQIVVSGAEAANYEMEYVNGVLTITDDAVVTANSYSRVYGDDNPTFEYSVDGATLSGTPSITCAATATSPVGTYDIVIAKGDVTNSEVTYVKGTLIITKAPLTITAKSYSVKQGKDLPTFELEYSGFKNDETDTVFTKKPTVSTTATKNSNVGTYEIVVTGADANNYEMKYVNGTLTITAKTESFDGNVLTVDEGGNMDDAFESYGGRDKVAKSIAAIVWNSTTPLTSDMLKGFDNPNMLIYVASKDQAPEGRDNVVIDGVASYIKLTDSDTGNNSFYAPKEFTADSIVYTREFKQETRKNVSRGWEGICLPFTVQTFTHETHGEIVPFGSSASKYHFWLHQFTKDGIVNAETIEANKPYLISMPNSDEYYEDFNQAGVIKFASADVTVPVTETMAILLGDSAQIVPTFQEIDASEYIYALNVGDSILTNPEGSIFVRNYRKVRPFEIYTFHEPSHEDRYGSRIISLSSLYGGNGTTGIDDVMSAPTSDVWYDLGGRRLQSKPSKGGLYIHNGRKVVIK